MKSSTKHPELWSRILSFKSAWQKIRGMFEKYVKAVKSTFLLILCFDFGRKAKRKVLISNHATFENKKLTFHITLIALPNDRYDLKKSDPHI